MNQQYEPFSKLWDEIARKLGLDSSRKEGPPPGPGNVRPLRPPRKRRIRLSIIIASIIVLLFVVLPWLVYLYTEWLWFGEVGFTSVFKTVLVTKALLAIGTGIFFFAVIYVNIIIARRMAPRFRGRGDSEVIERVPVPDRLVRWLIPLGLLLPTLIAMASGGSFWEEALKFLHRTDFGISDPVFNRDVGFYIFTLPVLQMLRSLAMWTLILALLATAATHFFDYAISWQENRLNFAPHVKAHLSILMGLIMLLVSGGYLLRGYVLMFSPRGVVFGASYSDVHAELPVLKFLAAVAVVAAVLFLINIYFRGWKLPAAAIILMILTSIVAGRIYPFVVQQYQVSPNELAKEELYIKNNIEFTRKAFDLETIEDKPFAAEESLTEQSIAENANTINNVRLWDPLTLAQTFSQIQTIRPYYQFLDVDVDRYMIDGKLKQVMLSPRELNTDALDPRAKTWQNEHLVYTHGYGAVVSPVAEVSGEGLPDTVVKDIPPQTTVPSLAITQPAIYFGEKTNDYVVVRSGVQEFDYPKGDENVYTTYAGNAGINIDGYLRRLAFSSRFASLKLLLSDAVEPGTRIMIHREIRDRIETVAPFLRYDADPYSVLVDGRVFWIQDAYTTATNYPYSQPSDDGMNYIRNSVKIAVDAYNGDVTFYVVDDADPIIRTYSKIFPELFTPGDQMPAAMRQHLRYPEDLFRIQANMYATYHMTDPQVFYNKEDRWNITKVQSGSKTADMDPYYVIMGLPGEPSEEFMLMLPFTPGTRDNMISWMAARSDPANYGMRLVFKFPKDKLVFGPNQIQARFNQDPNVSAQITLWSQSGSQVIFGNLLVIPVDQSILYVQPLYLRAERSQIPELKRVLVSYAGKVVMADDLPSGLKSIFGGAGASTVTGQAPATTTPTTPTTPAAGTATTPVGQPAVGIDQLAAQALDHYNKAVDAQRRGDWATYGSELKALEDVLRQMQAAGGTPVSGQ